MAMQAMGVNTARPQLGDLVRDAQQHGTITAITRNGKPAALLVPQASTAKFTAAEANPSWWPRVLDVLARDYPAINDAAWSTAIGENAAERVETRVGPPGTDISEEQNR